MLYALFLSGVFALNALAILHEDRFLPRFDLNRIDNDAALRGDLRAQAAGTIYFARYFRVLLIFVNIFTIWFENVYAGFLVSVVLYPVVKNNYTLVRVVHDVVSMVGAFITHKR